jgi:hypothetical protein
VVSTVQDLLCIVNTSSLVVEVLEVEVTVPGATASAMQRLRHKKYTGTITHNGTAVTPVKHETGSAASQVLAKRNATSSATTDFVVRPTSFNIMAGYIWVPTPEEKIVLAPNEGYAIDAPAIATDASNKAWSCSITYREIG